MDTRTFIIATNGRVKWWLHHTLEDLSPEQLRYRTPLIDDRPIAEVAMHAAVILLGNALVAAGKPWPLEDYPLDGWPGSAQHARPAALGGLGYHRLHAAQPGSSRIRRRECRSSCPFLDAVGDGRAAPPATGSGSV